MNLLNQVNRCTQGIQVGVNCWYEKRQHEEYDNKQLKAISEEEAMDNLNQKCHSQPNAIKRHLGNHGYLL